MRGAILSAVLLAACGVTEDNYDEKFASALCKYQSNCATAAFNAYYDDLADCVNDYADFTEAYAEYLTDCEFQKDRAADCLSSVQSAASSCDYNDLYDNDCYYVWDCPTPDLSGYGYYYGY